MTEYKSQLRLGDPGVVRDSAAGGSPAVRLWGGQAGRLRYVRTADILSAHVDAASCRVALKTARCNAGDSPERPLKPKPSQLQGIGDDRPDRNVGKVVDGCREEVLPDVALAAPSARVPNTFRSAGGLKRWK